MLPPSESEGLSEVLIRLRRDPPVDAEGVIHAIEHAGGRIKQAFLPTAVIAEMPADHVTEVVGQAGIEAADTGPIDETQRPEADADWRSVVSVWNQHLRARPAVADGRAWDAPGYLPPDPPAEIRERLRRREQELKSGEA